MAKRHQMLMHLHHSKSTFLEFEVSKGIGTKKIVPEILEPHVREAIDRIILYEVNSFCQSEALVRGGNRYGEDECIIIVYEDEPSFGLINSIFPIQRKDYLLCAPLLVNQFNTHFNSSEIEKSGYFEMIDFDSIYDYHPLGVYYVASKMLVPLHHHLRHSPEL